MPNQYTEKPVQSYMLAYLTNPTETNECIVWPFSKTSKGHVGVMKWKGNYTTATRVVLSELVGPPPSLSSHAAHKPKICHNKECINVRHLEWKSPSNNEKDKLIDGTHTRGSRNGSSKLTEDDVLEIYSSQLTHQALASKYGISRSIVTRIKNGNRWAWLTQTKENSCV